MSALMWKAAVPAGQYPEHSSPVMVRHGKAAPSSPSCRARSRAFGSVACRQRSASTAACGQVWTRTGSTKVSVSQKVWPS